MNLENAPFQNDVQQLLDRAVADGTESAIQVAAYLNGKLIVDAWSSPDGLPVDGDSLFPFFSTGKGLAATAVHRLAERGVLSWEEPIARHWPEFAAHGKGGITLRHALNHTAGLPMMPASEAQATDWEDMCRFLTGSTRFLGLPLANFPILSVHDCTRHSTPETLLHRCAADCAVAAFAPFCYVAPRANP